MWYILDENNKPIKSSVLEAMQWMEDNLDKKAVKQESISDVRISTVFLGLDHSFPWDNENKPVLWETMIFGGEHDQNQYRYTSYEEALEGHQRAIDLVKNSK